IKETATKDEIRKAYHKQSLRWHPDKNLNNITEATKKFKEINEAYEKLLEFIKK
ncbi:6487_t:CDS:1, partial [Cetraspora pellucida]